MTLYGHNGQLISGQGLTKAFIPEGVIHSDLDFIIHVREKILKYEKILKQIRNRNEGMAAKGYTPQETAEAEYKMLKLLDHWRGILSTYGHDE
jgi:hypothetical protein